MGGRGLARVRNERIGFVFQSFELLPRLTALKNVELPLLYSRAGWCGRRARAQARADDRRPRRPHAATAPTSFPAGRSSASRSPGPLVNSPAILLADEPTGNLDSRTSEEILALFDDLHRQGQTIIMVTHEADVARHARRVVRMKDGKVRQRPAVDEDASRSRRRRASRVAGRRIEDRG